MPQDDPKSTSAVMVGAVCGLLLLLLILLLQLYYYRSEREVTESKLGDPSVAFEALRAEQEGVLESGYYWLDQEAGVVVLPIERAMERIVENSSAGTDGR